MKLLKVGQQLSARRRHQSPVSLKMYNNRWWGVWPEPYWHSVTRQVMMLTKCSIPPYSHLNNAFKCSSCHTHDPCAAVMSNGIIQQAMLLTEVERFSRPVFPHLPFAAAESLIMGCAFRCEMHTHLDRHGKLFWLAWNTSPAWLNKGSGQMGLAAEPLSIGRCCRSICLSHSNLQEGITGIANMYRFCLHWSEFPGLGGLE